MATTKRVQLFERFELLEPLFSEAPSPDMLTDKNGEAAASELQSWANKIAKHADEAVEVEVFFDADSNTFVLRLVKGARVLIFRLSESQVHTDGREAECERTLNRKIKDLWNLI